MAEHTDDAGRAAAFAALRDHKNQYNWYLGTPEELIAAGVLEPYVLERPFTRSGCLGGHDDFGIALSIRKLSDGRFRVIKCSSDHDRRAAKTIEASVGPLVTALLERFARK